MEDINKIADYFIWFANEHGDPLTHLQLQKLCYFAEAFYLAYNDEPLTGEPFMAYIHGPVSKKLWDRLKKYDHRPVNNEILPIAETGDKFDHCYEKPELPDDVRTHLDLMIKHFWSIRTYGIECLALEHLPWKIARGNYLPLDHCETVIDPKDMRDFYRRWFTLPETDEVKPKMNT